MTLHKSNSKTSYFSQSHFYMHAASFIKSKLPFTHIKGQDVEANSSEIMVIVSTRFAIVEKSNYFVENLKNLLE